MFIAYVKQASEGCDYTIGCAQTLWRLNSKTKLEAIQEIKRRVIGRYVPGFGFEEGYWDDNRLKKVSLLEVSDEMDVPLSDWYFEAERFLEDEEVKRKSEIELKEYERLKRKFGQ